MKKILFVSFFIILFSSCSFSSKETDIEQAKKELLNQSSTKIESVENEENIPKLTKENILTGTTIQENKKEENKIIENKPSYKIEKLTQDQFIEIDDLSNKLENVISWIEITWKTLTGVDKIVVRFENKTSDFPIDVYTLGQFKPGDKTFVYRAKGEFKVLDYWENEYIFEAYSKDKVSKTKVIINIPKEIKETSHNIKNTQNVSENITYEKKLIWDWSWSVYLSFPKSPVFWDPLNVWTDLITYSNIDNLEIKRVNISSWTVNCDNMTNYLKQNINSWFYWNTCRNIIKDKWISVYVLKLDWDKYVYEKMYFDYNHWLVGTYILKNNILANKENVSEDIANKNLELKQTNKDSQTAYENYPELKIVDKLFYEIVR